MYSMETPVAGSAVIIVDETRENATPLHDAFPHSWHAGDGALLVQVLVRTSLIVKGAIVHMRV